MIQWRDGAGVLHDDSLFGVFAALARGEAWSFPALRPHQREPWHAFTVQVAALALIHGGRDDLPGDEATWRDLLIALTPDYPDGEAWSLVVDDWTKPALLQPPVPPSAKIADYKLVQTPDDLDILITSKNHDVKAERIAASSEEDWLFSLVTLQTYQGYSGRSPPTQFFHGISRMNGGSASRMSLSIRPSGGAGKAFKRDVLRLVFDARARRDRRSGEGLVWLIPWDGTQKLDFTQLDEWYVEVCRRIRIQRSADTIKAFAAPSVVTRIAAKDLNGKTRDPWAPEKADGSTSVSPSERGLGYRQMTQLLDKERVTVPLLARLHESDDREGLAFVAAALVRGKGTTKGLHRRAVRTSRVEEIEAFGDVEILDRVGAVAKERAGEAGEAGRRLRRALILLVQGGPDQARLDDDAAGRKVDAWMRRFDRLVDRVFFDDALWAEAAGAAGSHRRDWRERLRGLADTVLADAADAAPRTEMRRIRAIARSRTMLDREMAKWLKEIA